LAAYEIYPLPLHRMRASGGFMTYLMNYGAMVDCTGYSWYIRGPSKNIIVDTSCPIDMIRRNRPGAEAVTSFEGALSRVGLTPEAVDMVILTHLHYDHCGHLYKCVNADVVVQKAEVEYALSPHPLSATSYKPSMFAGANLHMIEGDTKVDDGVELLFTPGHTPGCQSVSVSTAKGTAVITGFCCRMDAFVMPDEVPGHTAENLKELASAWPVRAPGIHTDVFKAYDSATRVKELADIIIPNHDPMWEQVEKVPA
jgi:glyoxylase-like metal-dependent hydrolase (beta-lactamase superfamily II)